MQICTFTRERNLGLVEHSESVAWKKDGCRRRRGEARQLTAEFELELELN